MNRISVIIPTHNPVPQRFSRTLDALARQTLPSDNWSAYIVDNASDKAISISASSININIIREERLGVNWARLRGVTSSDGEVLVFVDDDNILSPSYLSEVYEICSRYPPIGAFGGRNIAEFENGHTPPSWTIEFLSNLAIRDFGNEELVSRIGVTTYPSFAPCGAGMVIRRSALSEWCVAAARGQVVPDRSGSSLTSGGDNEMIVYCLKAGFSAGYFPQLSLTHILPAARFDREYLARLNYGLNRGWVRLWARHGIEPTNGARPSTLLARKARAYLRTAAWSGPAAYVRWRGACGVFDGRGDVWRGKFES